MFYSFARAVVAVYVCLFYRLKLTGTENIPKEGGAILCSNHMSNFDPIVLAVYLKRQVSYMAKTELFKNKLFGKILLAVGAFPVDRDSQDMVSYKKAIKNLKEGKLLGIFVQGTRQKEIDVKTGRTGAAFFALKAGVPIIPVGISGTYKLFSKITVNFGEPVALDNFKDAKLKTEVLNEITESVMEKVLVLSGNGR